MARLSIEDAYSLGLLYVYLYSNKIQKMVLLDDLKKFHNCIENNLDKMKGNESFINCFDHTNDSIYFTSSDENGNTYYILKPEFDLEKARTLYIGCMPTDFIVASQMNNALSCLGLIKIEDKIFLKRNIVTKKNCYQNCSNCERNISQQMYENIIRENEEYRNISEDEAIKKIGYCEIFATSDVPRELDYWCPKYIPNEEFSDEVLQQNKVLKKIKK